MQTSAMFLKEIINNWLCNTFYLNVHESEKSSMRNIPDILMWILCRGETVDDHILQLINFTLENRMECCDKSNSNGIYYSTVFNLARG